MDLRNRRCWRRDVAGRLTGDGFGHRYCSLTVGGKSGSGAGRLLSRSLAGKVGGHLLSGADGCSTEGLLVEAGATTATCGPAWGGGLGPG